MRGKYLERYKASSNVVVLDPDVSLAFPNAAVVNEALRGLAAIASKVPALPNKARCSAGASPEARVRGFIDKFDPDNRVLIRAVRKALRDRFPTAYELAYDNYNFFVLGYSPTERPSDAVVSMAAGANGVGLCFIRGASLPDPKRILLGSGNQTRFIRVPDARALARPEVRALLGAAVVQSSMPFRATGKPTLVIRSVSAKQRPRRGATDRRTSARS